MDGSIDILELNSRQDWRGWLESNHALSTGVWLAQYKVNAANGRLTYAESVKEALCFGWIDGQTRSLDAERFAQRYSPRRPGSVWSLSNIRRVEKLLTEGRMTEAGLVCVRSAKENGAWQAAIDRELHLKLPAELEQALVSSPGSMEAFNQLKVSRQKELIYRVASAKRDETRQKRVQAILDELNYPK